MKFSMLDQSFYFLKMIIFRYYDDDNIMNMLLTITNITPAFIPYIKEGILILFIIQIVVSSLQTPK